jgi:hypothetical protein
VVGAGDDGLRGGCAALLEAYGCGFCFGGDSVPRRAALPWPVRSADGAPAFDARGLLPWYNFWDSPTTWNAGDWRDYLDAMARQKMNLIALHAYDFEPFCGFRYGGKWLRGEPLYSSARDNWGCHPMTTDEHGFGTGRIYYQDHFGSDLSTAGLETGKAMEAEQALLADAMAYAHAAGLRTCVGFEVSADPTDPEELRQLDARLRHVLSRYPLDYLWLWQPEGMGINGVSPPEPMSRWGTYVRRWHDVFAYLGGEQRIAEAVRVTLYVQAAYGMMKGASPKTRLAVAGWGGDQWLRFSDLFPGMDKLVPKDIIFGALDNISVTPGVSANYGQVKGRELWPTPWFEYDGDQWTIQANTRPWSGAVADAKAKGCSGILAIHWRTRAVEQSAAYMARFAWGEAGTVEAFYARLAREWFGARAAAAGAKVLSDLDALGYRWTGGGGEGECAPLGWAPGRDDAKLAKVRQCRDVLNGLLATAQADPGAPAMAAERLRWLIAMAEWVDAYELTARGLSGDGEALRLYGEAKAAADAKAGDAGARAGTALDALRKLPFGPGMAGLTPTVSDRGELGQLASINDKAWWAIREMQRDVAKLAGTKVSPEADVAASLGPAVVAFERPTTAPAHEELRLRVGLLGGGTGRLVWRPWGGQWRNCELRHLKRDVFEAVLAPADVRPPGIEWYVEMASPADKRARFPDRGGWATSVVSAIPKARWRTVEPPAGKPAPPTDARARQLDYGGVEVTWTASPDAGVAYAVTRRGPDGKDVALAIAFDTWLEDCRPPVGAVTYTLMPLRLGGEEGAPATATLNIASVRPAAPTGWKATAGPRRVIVELPPAGMGIEGWRVFLRQPGEAVWTPAGRFPGGYLGRPARAAVPAPGGRAVEVTVAAAGIGGEVSDTAAPATVTPADEMPASAVEVATATTGLPAGAELVGAATLGQDADGRYVDFQGGWVQMALPEALKDPCGLTLSLWIRPSGFAGRMPVIVDNGTWRQDGFFLQILGGTFRWHKAPATDCDGGAAQDGQWQRLVCVWDGRESALRLGGEVIARTPSDARFTAAGAPLFIGRYIVGTPEYEYPGRVRDLRIYPYALTEEELGLLEGNPPKGRP